MPPNPKIDEDVSDLGPGLQVRDEPSTARSPVERLLDALFASSPDLLCLIGDGGFFERVNPAWTDHLGWSEEELLARPFADFVHPDDLLATERVWEATASDRGGFWQFENRYSTKNGGWRWLQWSSFQMPEFGLDLGSARDVTDQRLQAQRLERSNVDLGALTAALLRSEEALRSSQQMFRLAWDHAPLGKAIVSIEGRFVNANPAFCAIVQRTEEDLLAATFQEITHPDDLDTDLDLVRQLLSGDIPHYQMEKRYLRPDGSIVWVLLVVALVRDELGNPECFISQMLDIDERKRHDAVRIYETRARLQAELAARREQDLATALLGAVSEAYSYTVDGLIVQVNDLACELTGFAREELIGSGTPFPFWPPEELETIRAAIEKARTGRSVPIELTFMRKTGERFPASVTARPARTAEGVTLGWVATMRDISTQKRREDDLADIATRDHLTRLYNRRAIDARMDVLQPGDAVIALDLDRFKAVNDRLGHAAGDEVLRILGETIASALRANDWAGRLGGEEFIVVLGMAGIEGAEIVDRRLRQRWSTTKPLTSFSAGIAEHQAGDEPRQTLARADEALYRAKDAGRNRTEVSYNPS